MNFSSQAKSLSDKILDSKKKKKKLGKTYPSANVGNRLWLNDDIADVRGLVVAVLVCSDKQTGDELLEVAEVSPWDVEVLNIGEGDVGVETLQSNSIY